MYDAALVKVSPASVVPVLATRVVSVMTACWPAGMVPTFQLRSCPLWSVVIASGAPFRVAVASTNTSAGSSVSLTTTASSAPLTGAPGTVIA